MRVGVSDGDIPDVVVATGVPNEDAVPAAASVILFVPVEAEAADSEPAGIDDADRVRWVDAVSDRRVGVRTFDGDVRDAVDYALLGEGVAATDVKQFPRREGFSAGLQHGR